MDQKDHLLLALLRRDARRPLVALARDLGLSRSATQARVARLRASGAIAGFTVKEAPGGTATAYLQIGFAPGHACAQVVPKLKRIPAVTLIHSLAGQPDLLVRLEGRDLAAVEQARSAVAAVPGIASLSTHVVLERHLD